MSNKNLDNLLIKLIEKRPDNEDKHGKYITLGNTRIYSIEGKLIAVTIGLLLLIGLFLYSPAKEIVIKGATWVFDF